VDSDAEVGSGKHTTKRKQRTGIPLFAVLIHIFPRGCAIRKGVTMRFVGILIFLMLVSPAEAKSFFFPHYADGNGFAMKLVISNHSESHASGWLSVFDSYGRISPLPFEIGETGRVELALAPHATLTLVTRGTSAPMRTGYIEVNADQEALSGLAIFKNADGMEASTFPISAGREFSLFVERTPLLDTGLAICTLSPASILLKLFDLNGQLIDTAILDSGGAFQQARFVSQLLKLTPAFQGTLSMKSEGLFAPFGLRFGASVLSSLPAVGLDAIGPSTGITYYIDSDRGSDQNNGTSQDSAWKSLDRVNGRIFGPGDRILFRAGTSYAGQFRPRGSGGAGKPIIVDKYGEGALPRIDGGGRLLETVLLYNVEQWELRNLEITNNGATRVPKRKGISLHIKDFGTANHIVMSSLYIHDVNGSNVKDQGGGAGIEWRNEGDRVPSKFNDLLIENCHLIRTDRNGIIGSSAYWPRDKWNPSLNVVIRGNLLEDIGGDGIVPIGCDGALVERNTLRGGRQRADDYAAGIWPWSCDNTIVQFNEVSGMKGTKDGQGYDSDWNCRNSLFQYNYSHDNDGGFMLICTDGGTKMPWNTGNTGTIIRYNISQNDGARLFHISGPVRGVQIYNNDFYVGSSMDILAILHGNWGGDWAEDVRFQNNIFYVDGRVRYDFGSSRNNQFDSNVFFGNHVNPPADSHALTQNPLLVKSGSGGAGRETLEGYKLAPGSPCIGSGTVIMDNGGRDFWGNPVAAGAKPSIGAHAFPR